MQAPLQVNTTAAALVRAAEEGSLPTPTAAKPAVRKSSGGGNKKGTSAERRATHNAVERARRESLNYRFLELAANLPATCTVRRASKNLIVNKSLEFVRNALHSDAVLRLKLDEVMRQNQSLLDEVNQLRAERGLSPRTNPASVQAMQEQPRQGLQPSSGSNANTTPAVFSTDALTAAFGMPGLPQPLATVEFTKQVTEQNITLDYNNSNAWFSSEQDDDGLSNNASADDFSAAASDHSSPSLGGENVKALAASVGGVPSTFPTSAMFQGVHMPTASVQQQQQQQQPQHTATPSFNVFAQPQMASSYSSSGSSAYNEGSPTSYAHYSGHNSHNVASTPMIQFTTPYTPTSAAMLQQMLSLGTTGAAFHPSLSPSSGIDTSSAPSMNGNTSSAYAQGGIYAMPA